MKGAVQANGRIVRESMIAGPTGFLGVETIWEDTKLITIKLFGSR
jgi:hypothetical protein